MSSYGWKRIENREILFEKKKSLGRVSRKHKLRLKRRVNKNKCSGRTFIAFMTDVPPKSFIQRLFEKGGF